MSQSIPSENVVKDRQAKPDPNQHLRDLFTLMHKNHLYFQMTWINGLGEELTSRIHTAFMHGDSTFAVVHDWREGTRSNGLVVREITAGTILHQIDTRTGEVIR